MSDENGPHRPASKHYIESTQLTQGLRANRPEAWTAAYALYHKPMLRRAKKTLRNPADASDVVNDAWLTLLSKIQTKPDDPAKLTGYVLQIVSFKALELNRKSVRRCTHTGEELAIDAFPSEQPNPEEGAIRQQSMAHLDRQLEQLHSPRDREILRALLIKSEDRDTVRTRYGLTHENFSKVLSRARKRLRSLCDAPAAPGGDQARATVQ